jgi:putative hydrolase of the HAD superfamily
VLEIRNPQSSMLLLIDADDTLWENNIYFERVIQQFIEFVNHQHYSCEEIRRILDEIELANRALHGYGWEAFGRNLQEAFRRLATHPVSQDQLKYVEGLAAAIARQELEILPEVPETLEYLAGRHRLVLFTKGSAEEQHAKLARSGLARFFSEAVVTKEKDEGAYRRLAAQLGSAPAQTWMVGNSPRSDINPALAAGINAVWIPHANTWSLEQEELRAGPGRLVIVSRFARLRAIF